MQYLECLNLPKCVLDDILRVGALQPLAEKSQEHGEVDGAWSLIHHTFQIIFRRVLTCDSK